MEKIIVTNLKNFFQQRDLNFFYGLNKISKIHVFRNTKSIFIFQKWTKINVQKSIFKNNLGFSTNVAFI